MSSIKTKYKLNSIETNKIVESAAGDKNQKDLPFKSLSFIFFPASILQQTAAIPLNEVRPIKRRRV